MFFDDFLQNRTIFAEGYLRLRQARTGGNFCQSYFFPMKMRGTSISSVREVW